MLLRMQEQDGKPPLALATRPELFEHLNYVVGIYRELSRERRSNFNSYGPIELEQFKTYAEFWDIPKPHAQELWKHIRTLDNTWLKLSGDKQAKLKAEAAKKQKSPVKKARR